MRSLGRPCGSRSPLRAARCACPLWSPSVAVRRRLGHARPGQGGHRCPVSLHASPSLRQPRAGMLRAVLALLPPLPASPCPSPSGRSATRRRSSGRPRRRGQRSGSSGGPGPGPCTTAPLRTRTVSAGRRHPGSRGSAAGWPGTALRCSAQGGWDPANPAQPRCWGVALPSPRAAPGPDGVPRLLPALGGLGVSWRLRVTVTVLHRDALGDSPGCLRGRHGHTARVSGSWGEAGMGCGAARGRCRLSSGSVLRRVPLSPGWVGQCLAPPAPACG